MMKRVAILLSGAATLAVSAQAQVIEEVRIGVMQHNVDAPGFIGQLGMMLGEDGVNIATFHLGRTDAGGEAIALVGIDADPSAKVVTELAQLEAVRYVKVLRF